MRNVMLALIAVGAMFVTNAFAQEPPGWTPLGNLPYATQVRGVIEVPGTDTLVACGCGYEGNGVWVVTWRSTDAGASWYGRLIQGGPETLAQLDRDSASGRIWTVVWGRSGANTLYSSTDNGEDWTGVSGPATNPAVTANCIEIHGDYLYFGGSIASPYNISLYRLNQTNLTWEVVSAYPQCNAIAHLKFHDGKLFVFCRDKDENKVRVFTYTPGDLDRRAQAIGKAHTSIPRATK